MHSPAFQFYVQDFLTGTMHMSAEEVGAYILLLCHQWDKGALPANDKELLRIARIRMKVLEVVKGKFAVGEDGLLRNVRLEKEREKQLQWKEKAAKAGKISGEVRRTKMNDRSNLVQTKTELNTNSSTSSSTSSSERDISVSEPKDFLKQKNVVALDDIRRTVPDDEWEHCLGQWNLSVLADPHWSRTSDEARDMQILMVRLRKWCATWTYNLQKEKIKHVKSGDHRHIRSTDGIAAAAMAVLSGDHGPH
jgi:uncharacterized protein YdaU (DUF1376 family)